MNKSKLRSLQKYRFDNKKCGEVRTTEQRVRIIIYKTTKEKAIQYGNGYENKIVSMRKDYPAKMSIENLIAYKKSKI